MANVNKENKTYRETYTDYNYNKSNANSLIWDNRTAFDNAASRHTGKYIRVIVDSSRTITHNTYISQYSYISKNAPMKQPNVDLGFTVKLGGEFEQIGEIDEEVGGGNQKVGSNN